MLRVGFDAYRVLKAVRAKVTVKSVNPGLRSTRAQVPPSLAELNKRTSKQAQVWWHLLIIPMEGSGER